MSDVAKLLDLLERPGLVAVCHKNGSGPFTGEVVDVADAQAVVDSLTGSGQRNVWISLARVEGPAGRPGRGTVAEVRALTALPVDLDVKPGGMPSWEAAEDTIATLSSIVGSEPVAVVNSGHGLQPWFALDPDDPEWTSDGPDDPRLLDMVAVVRRWQRLVAHVAGKHGGAVDSTKDLARVQRAPGSTNWKDPANPVPVTVERWGAHTPITLAHLLDVLDEYGVEEVPEDRDLPGEVRSACGDWEWADRPCEYASAMVDGWAVDVPKGKDGRSPARHPWLVGQAVRLAAAHRYGCLRESDHQAGVEALASAFRRIVADRTVGEPRKVAPGEIAGAIAWGVARVEGMTDEQVTRNLGGHVHRGTADEDADGDPGERGSDGDPGGEEDDGDPSSSWEPVDLTGILDGTFVAEEPTLLAREDGRHLLYAGRVHSFHGESESGKSFVAQAVAGRPIAGGEVVLYVDYESDAGTIVGRLRAMDVPDDKIAAGLVYVHPDENPHGTPDAREAFRALLARPYALAVVDGVTEAIVLAGGSSKDNDGIADFMRRLPRRIAQQTGAAVVMIDHVVKDADARGRFAIGGQQKMAALDGASYTVEVKQPLGVGMRGVLSLRVGKDRPGQIRPYSGAYRASDRTQEAARVIVDSTEPGRTVVTVEAPTTGVDEPHMEASTFRPTTMMEKVSRLLEKAAEPLTGAAVEAAVEGKAKAIRAALFALAAEDYIAIEPGPRNARLHRSTRPYRQADDPRSDRFRGTR